MENWTLIAAKLCPRIRDTISANLRAMVASTRVLVDYGDPEVEGQ